MKPIRILNVLKEEFGMELSEKEVVKLYTEWAFYITKYTSAYSFQTNIGTLSTEISRKTIRLRLLHDKYTFLGMKLFIFKLNTVKSLEEAITLGRYEGILKSDVERLYTVWTKNSKFRVHVKRMVKDVDVDHLELDFVDKYFTSNIHPNIMSTVSYFAYNKLRFITKSSNLEMQDLKSELVLRAVQAYYTEIPTLKDEEYLINYIKKSIHNHTINLIKEYTSQKKGRIKCISIDTNGIRDYVQLEVSASSLNSEDGDSNILESFMAHSVDTTLSMESEHDIEKLLYYCRNLKVLGKVLRCMFEFDPGFTDWLVGKGYCHSGVDNTSVQEAVGVATYRRYLCSYFKVSEHEMKLFISELGRKLRPREV